MRRAIIKAFVLTAIAGLSAAALPAVAQQSQTPGTSADTSGKTDTKAAKFLKQAAQDNDYEISLAQVGAMKAENAELKTLCQQLQKDHVEANKTLQPIAQKYNVSVDQSLKWKNEHEVSKFQKENSGSKLDQQLALELLKEHQKDITKFQSAESDIQESDVKQYIDTMLPKLREHFQHAQTVALAVGVDQSTVSSIAKKVPAGVGGSSSSFETQPSTGAGDKSSQGQGSKDLQPTTPPSQP